MVGKGEAGKGSQNDSGNVDSGYAFNDPDFVAWWLQSLFLLDFDDQVRIAMELRLKLNTPEVMAEIDAFVVQRSFQTEVDLDGAGDLKSRDLVIAESLRGIWQRSPWMAGGAVVAALFFAGKGIWFVGREVFRIVF